MKLDSRGWGLQELIVGLSILFFCLLLVVILINQNFKQLEQNFGGGNLSSESSGETSQERPEEEPEEGYSSYKEIEAAMVSAAKKYNTAIYGADLQEGDNLTVTLNSLIRDDYLEKIYDIKDEDTVCTGYVTFIKEGSNVSYSPYLKCGKRYQTKGYLERLDTDVK